MSNSKSSDKHLGQALALSSDAWLEALLDPAVSIRFVTYGYTPLPAEWGFADRAVPEHLVYAVVERELAAEINGRSWRIRPGGFCLLPPGTRHTFAHGENSQPVTLHFFRLELLLAEAAVHLDRAPVVLEAGPSLREHLERLHDARQSGDAAVVRTRANLALLFSCAFRLAEGPPTARPALSDEQRSRLYDLVRQSAGRRLGPSDLARHVDLSLDYFTRQFRETFGMPPRRWIVEQRINVAAALLADSTLHVSQVARQLGYPDIYQFSHQFKQVLGVSPRAYRKRISQQFEAS